jgi:tape measure domain-containing protein
MEGWQIGGRMLCEETQGKRSSPQWPFTIPMKEGERSLDVFKLIGKIIIESDEAIDGLEAAEKEAREAGQAFENADGKARKLSDGFTVLKGIASNLITDGFRQICSAIGDFVSDGYEYSKQIENYATSFAVMTGSEEKAIEITQKLQEIGASTPFELPQLANTTQLLMNYGFTADEAVAKMTMLGDISQGNSEKMSRIATAYGQMSSAGKVTLGDVKQMIEAGFNPLQEIAESTGESMESLYDRISAGTISVDEITASMVRSTSEGGKYFGSMEKQSATLDGRLSTLKDTANESISNVLAPLLQRLSDEWLPKVTDAVSKADEKFTAVGNWISEHQGLFIALGAVIGIVTTALTAQAVVQAVQIAMNAAEVTSLGALIAAKAASAAATLAALAPYLLITAAIAAVIAVIVLCVQHWDEIKAKTIEVATAIAQKVESMVATVKEKFLEIKDSIQKALTEAYEKVLEIWGHIKGIFSDAVDVGKRLIEDIKQGISDAWEGLKSWFRGIWDGLFGNLSANVAVNGSGGTDGSHASGLDYVPFDGYIAELHKGEMVVPADEARMLRNGVVRTAQDDRMVDLLSAMVEINQEMLQALLAGKTFKVGEREFARLVKQYA